MVTALSALNSGFGINRDVLELQQQMGDLQRQLATGKKSETYGGLGTDRVLVMSLKTRITSVESFTKSIDLVQIRLDAVQQHLDRVREIGAETRSNTLIPDYTSLNGNKTHAQLSASSHLDEMVSLLNFDLAGRHLFSGRTTDVSPVVTSDILLNGDGAAAGFSQVIAERKQADLGASGLGRLAITSAAPAVSLTEDAPGHPFGIKLAGVTSTLTGTTATGTPSNAATIGSIDLGVDVAANTAGVGSGVDLTVGANIFANSGTLDVNGQTFTITGGVTSVTDLTGFLSGLSAAVGITGSIVGGEIDLTADTNTTTITTTVTGGAALEAELGLGTSAVAPPTNATIAAITGTATLQVGAGAVLTLDFDASIANRQQLEAALGTLAGGTATVNGSNFIDITATSATDPIIIGGLADVSLGLADDATISPTSSAINVTFSATLPQDGETFRATFSLPDGTQEVLELTATTTTPLGDNEFLIGIDENDTAANFETALNTSLQTFAATKLASASTAAAANDFFFYDDANPPQRVNGPPFDSATSLIDATAADTVFWYQGDNGTGSPRDAAIARVDENLNVGYGIRANETPLATLVSSLAMLTVESFDAAVPEDKARYTALTERTSSVLNFDGQTSVEDVIVELGFKQRSLQDTADRHGIAQQVSLDLLQGKEGADNYEVSAKILSLQSQISASFETTALLSRLSLVNFL